MVQFPQGAEHSACRERMTQAARFHVAASPARFIELQDFFREFDPESRLAFAACYGLQRAMDSKDATSGMSHKFEQFQVKLM